MKIPCYNKGAKEKETNKKCFNITKKGENTDAWLNIADKECWQKGRRDTTKEKHEIRRVRKAMIPYEVGAAA